jgi:hypothetical protein
VAKKRFFTKRKDASVGVGAMEEQPLRGRPELGMGRQRPVLAALGLGRRIPVLAAALGDRAVCVPLCRLGPGSS